MDIKTIVTAFTRMMQRKFELAGQPPGNYERLEWVHIAQRASAHRDIPVVSKLLDTWTLQLQRELDMAHLSQEAMQRMWADAIAEGEAWVAAQTADDGGPETRAQSTASTQTMQPDKALKRRFGAYVEAFRAAAPDTSHAQWLTLLARAEGFKNFQALKSELTAGRPAFCPHCGSAGNLREVGTAQYTCGSCHSSFSLSLLEQPSNLSPEQIETLENLGYEVKAAGPALYFWVAPTDTSERQFSSQDAAWRGAWDDASQQAQALTGTSEVDWRRMPQAAQCRALAQALGDD